MNAKVVHVIFIYRSEIKKMVQSLLATPVMAFQFSVVITSLVFKPTCANSPCSSHQILILTSVTKQVPSRLLPSNGAVITEPARFAWSAKDIHCASKTGYPAGMQIHTLP